MNSIYRIFIKGLITLFPITLTAYLIAWIATRAETLLGDPLRNWLPEEFVFPGMGVILGFVLVFFVGLTVNHYLARGFVVWIESRMERLPLIRAIYGPLRDVTNLFANKDSGSTPQRVVMVQMEGLGVEVMGLVTRDSFTDLPEGSIPESHAAVFLPFSYGVGGYTVIVPKSRIRETAIPTEKAMQLAITGWIKTTK